MEFPDHSGAAGEQAAFSKSAPNLEKSKPPPSSLSPLPQRLTRGAAGSSSATSLGKSQDEGLNRTRGKKVSTTQYYRGHTTNLCSGISSSHSSPFKKMLSDGAGFKAGGGGSGSCSLLMRRVQDNSSSSSSVGGVGVLPEKEGVGCFGMILGGGAASPNRGMFSSARQHKKFSLDNSGPVRGEGGSDVTYDIAFYRKMQQSVDELFDERRFAKSTATMFNSRSSGDLLNSDESFSESNDSSEFRRECFFNKSAPEPHETSSALGSKVKSRSGSLPKGGANEKFQYSSLNDLLGTATKTPAAGGAPLDSSRDLYGDHSGNSAQYSNSSSSSSSQNTASSSSRKNSQVSFDEAKPAAKGPYSSVKLPPMRSEVSPRKFEKIYNLGTVEGPKLGSTVAATTQKGGKPKIQRSGFITSLFKMGHRSVEKRTAKREGRDEKVNLVTANDEEEDTRHHVGGGGPGGDLIEAATTYDMIYTKRHIIAKQSDSLFRSDSQ